MAQADFIVYKTRIGADLRATARVPFDAAFRADIRLIPGAIFHREHGQWSVPTAETARLAAIVSAARLRREEGSSERFARMSRAQKAAWFDAGLNEGGEGFNPYRDL